MGEEGGLDGSGEPPFSVARTFNLKIALNFQPWNSPVGIHMLLWSLENQTVLKVSDSVGHHMSN